MILLMSSNNILVDFLIILGIIIIAIIYLIVFLEKRTKFVKEHSKVLENLYTLNLEYSKKILYNFKSVYEAKVYLNSKRAFDKYKYLDYLNNYYVSKNDYWRKQMSVAKNNSENWQKYKDEYTKLDKCRTKEESIIELENKISVETFWKIEKKLFNKNKLSIPDTYFAISVSYSYTSPSGRNHYEGSFYISYKTLYDYFKEIDNAIELQLKKEREKYLAAEARKEAERKKRETLRRAEEIIKRESEVVAKEEEFKKATQGHIYSTSLNPIVDSESKNIKVSKIAVEDDIVIILDKLKQKLENGEITIEEYRSQRNALL